MNELISVIVPIYNIENYIDRCIESIVSQTYQNLEIILVDDGSIDSSREICDKWGKADKRIKCIHKLNGGLSSARNNGIDIANGDYIAFVDGDDWVDSKMYEVLYNAIATTKGEIAMCGMYLSDGKFNKKYKCISNIQVYDKKSVIKEILLEKSVDVSVCNKLYRKEIFESLRFPIGENNEDAAVVLDSIENVSRAVHVGVPLYYYFQREKSISNTYSRKNLDDLYKHSLQIENRIIHDYPELEKYANVYVLNQIITIIKCLLQDRNENREREMAIYKEELKNYETKDNIKYLTLKRKILLRLMHLRLDVAK